MDQREALQRAREYVIMAKRAVEYKAAFMFGSYVQGTFTEYSDIDVGLFVDDLDESIDYLSLLAKLYDLSGTVDVRIEPHLFIRSEDRSGFAAEVERTGVPLRE